MEAWRKAETRVQGWLERRGIRAKKARARSPFDLRTSAGVRIEVKYCPFKERPISKGTKAVGYWKANIHRHGVKDESAVDFYALVLAPDTLGLIGKAPVILFIPAPLRTKTVHISVRLLLGKYAKYIGAWQEIYYADLRKITGRDAQWALGVAEVLGK